MNLIITPDAAKALRSSQKRASVPSHDEPSAIRTSSRVFAQFALRLSLIRGAIPLIGKLDGVSKSPGLNSDVQVAISRLPTTLASTVITLAALNSGSA